MEEAFMTKMIEYQPLLNIISELGYQSRLLVLILGSLGHTQASTTRDAKKTKQNKKQKKNIGLAKYSVCYYKQPSYIWRRQSCTCVHNKWV